VLAREEQKPYGRAEYQDQAYAQEKTQHARRSDIHQPPGAAGDNGQYYPDYQADQPRREVRSEDIYRRYLVLK